MACLDALVAQDFELASREREQTSHSFCHSLLFEVCSLSPCAMEASSSANPPGIEQTIAKNVVVVGTVVSEHAVGDKPQRDKSEIHGVR